MKKIKIICKIIWEIIVNPSSILEIHKWLYYSVFLKNENTLTKEIPWITFKAIDYLNKNLKNDFEVFEYGSGGSTIFFTKRVKHVISVEHDKKWFTLLQKKLSKINNLELYLIENQTKGNLFNKRDNKYYDNYVNGINKLSKNKKYDVIVIDGRQRPACFKESLKFIKKGGFLLFDNFDRKYYQKSLNCINNNEFLIINLKGFVPFGTMQSLTTIFLKIK